ncbi:biliverdin-producing heme oxygenase [Novosphingobium malaysiense]|uniref:biliverdin-producing heme oxygenase n=1 Tax=Novosphingobium malaysiense TaxID=1348853 RepID=UPI0006917636|nr:biliverdin-producing heme oxygenase [Novosphingobium malaysiense]
MQHAVGGGRAARTSPDMLALLRERTGPSHERLDAAFGSLVLDRRADLIRFLSAHAIGLAPLQAVFRRFVEEELGLAAPDYLDMLRDDLHRLGMKSAALPTLATPPEIAASGSAAGVGYVIAGSRLGLAVIRRQGYWGEQQGFRSRYMEDDSGPACWKALLPWLREHAFTALDCEAVPAAALASFDTFARAFAVSPAEESLKEMGVDG